MVAGGGNDRTGKGLPVIDKVLGIMLVLSVFSIFATVVWCIVILVLDSIRNRETRR